MNSDLRLFLVRHGAIVALLGAFSGLAYTFVITGDLSGSMRAWHLAHLQGVLTGILLIAASSFITHLPLSPGSRSTVAYSFVITGYCYSIGPIFGAFFGVRGIEPVAPLSNLVMYTSNLVASISIIVGLVLTIYGASKKTQDAA
jgi:hypothetical protein